MNSFTSLFFFLISLATFGQGNQDVAKFINPPGLSKPNGYSHAAVVDLGNCYMVTMAGQVALDKQGNLVGKDDLSSQTRQVFINLKNILAELGGSMDNLIKLNYYLLDVKQIQKVRDVRNEFINLNTPPASTLVEVSRLFRDDMLIEIEGVAIIPKKDK